MVMRCCDQNIEKAQAALNVASGILQESQRRAAEANSDLAAVRSRIDAAQKAHDTAKAAQANQKY
jgi:exonuclease VII small subunit